MSFRFCIFKFSLLWNKTIFGWCQSNVCTKRFDIQQLKNFPFPFSWVLVLMTQLFLDVVHPLLLFRSHRTSYNSLAGVAANQMQWAIDFPFYCRPQLHCNEQEQIICFLLRCNNFWSNFCNIDSGPVVIYSVKFLRYLSSPYTFLLCEFDPFYNGNVDKQRWTPILVCRWDRIDRWRDSFLTLSQFPSCEMRSLT